MYKFQRIVDSALQIVYNFFDIRFALKPSHNRNHIENVYSLVIEALRSEDNLIVLHEQLKT